MNGFAHIACSSLSKGTFHYAHHRFVNRVWDLRYASCHGYEAGLSRVVVHVYRTCLIASNKDVK